MAKNHSVVTHPDGWRLIQPRPTRDELKAFYANEYFQASHGTYAPNYSPAERGHRALIARTLLFAASVARRGAAGGRFLEVGCGEGWLLAAAEAAGFEVRGLDFSDDGLMRFHPELLDRATFGDAFENLERLIETGAKFDVIALEHVLEHVLEPERLLQRLPRLLAPGGVCAITVPNDFSPLQLAAREAGQIDREFWLAPPQHLNYFEARSLTALLDRLGFEVRLGYASFPIDWFLMHPGSNYVADAAAGKPAHAARMAIDLMLANSGMPAYLALGQALFGCGAG
ncbi:MAG TPA: class I SAM-dependent methyltransferase, partial [Caulobacteraceae bacterium]|nr:class I SAM-dependent methyltransferase [Caulobacteraceae bacterium]